ncbi:hypothetical protein R1sor_019896 [Riccia sorocarpa]|uniref:DUF659 domain-containing protein n=1 Tax=Riccia sorocarpa TaxID=122646 RepID=A0ABD3IFH7_9MARC
MGVRTPKSELARKVMGEYTFRTHEGQSFATCRYCGLEYVYNITRLTTHFTGDHEPRGGALQPRKGSVKHVKVCGSVPYVVKEAIRSLHRNKTSKQREIREDSERQSASAMPDEEDRDIQREFARTLLEENLSNTPANEPTPSQRSTHTSPSTAANVSANLPRNPSPLSDITSSRRHIQQPLRPMMDAAQRKIADEKWSMALSVMGLPFRTLAHPMFREAYNFSSKLPGYKFPSSTALRTTLLDKNFNDVKKTAEQNMWSHNFCVRATVSCDGWTNRNGRPQVNLVIVNRYGEMVYDHADGSNVTKNAKWVAANMIKVIREVGPKNVLQFTADNNVTNFMDGITSWRTSKNISKYMEKGSWVYECDGDELKIWMEKCNDELESIVCQNAAVWTLPYKEKALSEKTKNNPLACKRHRKIARLLNTYYTSRVQQTILKRRHGSEYGASGDVRDAWIPDRTIEENKFFAETRGNLDDTRLGFDAREEVLDDEILDDMRTRAEASTADAINNEYELGGDGILDESREQPLRHLDDLRDEDFVDEDVPPPSDTFDTNFETDDMNPNHLHGRSFVSQSNNDTGDESILLEVDTTTALRCGVGCIELDDLNQRFPRRRLPRVRLNEPGVLLSTNKLRDLVEIYSVPKTSGNSSKHQQQPSRFRPSSGESTSLRPSKVRRTDNTNQTPEYAVPKNPVTSTSEDPPQASPLSIPNTHLSTNPPDDTIHSSPERRRSGRPLSPVNYKEAF